MHAHLSCGAARVAGDVIKRQPSEMEEVPGPMPMKLEQAAKGESATGAEGMKTEHDLGTAKMDTDQEPISLDEGASVDKGVEQLAGNVEPADVLPETTWKPEPSEATDVKAGGMSQVELSLRPWASPPNDPKGELCISITQKACLPATQCGSLVRGLVDCMPAPVGLSVIQTMRGSHSPKTVPA